MCSKRVSAQCFSSLCLVIFIDINWPKQVNQSNVHISISQILFPSALPKGNVGVIRDEFVPICCLPQCARSYTLFLN